MKTLFLAFSLLLCQTVVSQELFITSKKQEAIKTYIEHFENNDQIMGTVSIFEDGKEVLNKTFGEKNLVVDAVMDRKYTIGSITKLFTAVLFAKLQEAHKIDLEEKLSNYFPLIPNAEKIEIKHMLNHSSGLKDYVTKNDSLHFWLKEPRTMVDIMREIIRQEVAFEPGDDVRYSNSAYFLLGKVLEKKHNKTYAQIITDEISSPLNLKNTFAITPNTDVKNIACSYSKKEGKWIKMEDFYFPNTSGVGNIVTTASDMNTFLDALFTGKIIPKETLQTMLPHESEWFGLGIMKVPFYEHVSFGHGGDTVGSHSVASYATKNNIAITYIINGEYYPTNDFAIGLYSIIYDKEYVLPEFKEYKPDKRFFEGYSGTYSANGFPISLKIFVDDGNLMAQGEGQPAFMLSPIEKHVFEFKNAGIIITFKPFAKTLVLKQAGQVFELKNE